MCVMCVVYVCTCVQVCVPILTTIDLKMMSGALFFPSLHYSLETGSSNSRSPLVSMVTSTHVTVPGFYVGSKDSDSSAHDCAESTQRPKFQRILFF